MISSISDDRVAVEAAALLAGLLTGVGTLRAATANRVGVECIERTSGASRRIVVVASADILVEAVDGMMKG